MGEFGHQIAAIPEGPTIKRYLRKGIWVEKSGISPREIIDGKEAPTSPKSFTLHLCKPKENWEDTGTSSPRDEQKTNSES